MGKSRTINGIRYFVGIRSSGERADIVSLEVFQQKIDSSWDIAYSVRYGWRMTDQPGSM